MDVGEREAHRLVREISAELRGFRDRCPDDAPPASRWRTESNKLRGTSHGGGRVRSQLLDEVHLEARFRLTPVVVYTNGMSDLLEAAAQRSDYSLNTPSAMTLARSGLEAASIVHWLLDPQAPAVDRVRRYLVWQLEDFRDQWKIAEGTNSRSGHQHDGAVQALHNQQQQLADKIDAAGWQMTPRRTVDGSAGGPFLLGQDGQKKESRPGYRDLIAQMLPKTGPIYSQLSATAHSTRLGITAGLFAETEPDGSTAVWFGGNGSPADAVRAIGLACVRTAISLEDATGTSASRLRRLLTQLNDALPDC